MVSSARIADAAAQLPIGEVLAAIAEQLAQGDELVLQAPPGAGKTTLVPLSLLHEPWLAGGKILVLEPRRMAARAAAARMAELLGEAVGQTVGYRVRLDSCVSAATRIEVVTEGVLGRLLLDDPALTGVGLLIFDEYHERSLDADLGLALALQGRELFREPADPLKLLVMSATLDGEALSGLLNNAPLLNSEGRQYPVTVHYAGVYQPGASIVGPVVDLLVQRVLAEVHGSGQGAVLVFLPGQREIHQVRRALHGQVASWPEPRRAALAVAVLHGGLGLEAQQQAIAPAPMGVRKVVLATNIAETSLTIPGVDIVVDCGLARAPRFEHRTGVTRLHTVRISRDASVQRAGRAGRLRPGTCYRLWSEVQQGQLAAHRVPEIRQADLMPLALQLLGCGSDDPDDLSWLDPPPAAAFAQAMALLDALGALEAIAHGGYRLSRHGERMLRLPLHPRLAHMVLRATRMGLGELACELAALLAERDPVRSEGADIVARLMRLSQSTGYAAEQRAWRQRVQRQAQALRRTLRRIDRHIDHCDAVGAPVLDASEAPGVLLALAFPDRIARRREPGGLVYQLANGRAAALTEHDTLRNSEWLVVSDTGGQAGQVQDRIFAAAALSPGYLHAGGVLAELVSWEDVAHWDDAAGRFVAERRATCGVLVLAREPLANVSLVAKRQALLALLARRGLQLLPWNDDLRQWQGRVSLLRAHWSGPSGESNPWPEVTDQALLASLPQWLGDALDPVRSVKDFGQIDLAGLLSAMLPWPLSRQLGEWAPSHWQAPSGTRLALDYRQTPPVMAVKLQEMFGCRQGPVVAQGKVPVVVHLLSPARRPLQITSDLAGFWAGSYHAIKKDMKGRYPKHPWPDDPLTAEPTRFTRRRRPS